MAAPSNNNNSNNNNNTNNDTTDIKFTVMVQNSGKDAFYPMSLPSDTDISTLKLVIETQSNIASNHQELSYKNIVITSNNATLKSLNIQNQDVIVIKNLTQKRIDLSMPVFSPFADIPTMPEWLKMDSKQLQVAIRNDSTLMQQLLHQNPTFAQALLSDDLTLLNGYLSKIRQDFHQKVGQEQQRRIMLNADPLNPEYQKLIANELNQENINQNYATAVEEMPEAFGRVIMLYIPMEIEGIKLNAFIDSGAQSTIMSKRIAIKCNLMRLVDTRFAGIAKGVGTAKIIGRVHIAKIKFGNIYLPSSFTIIDQDDMDFLFGLDMLRRHQGIIDLKKNVLRINNEEVAFLQEKDIPHLKQQQLQQQQQQQLNNNNNGMDIDQDAALQNALLQSAATANQQNKNNNNNNNNNNAVSNNNNNNVASSNNNNAPVPSNNNNNAPSNNNNNNFNENDITTLVNLGYTRNQAISALQACNYNVDMAASYLFSAGGGFGF